MIGGRRRVTVHVLFYGSIVGGFWSFLNRPGWRHCLLLISIYFPAAGVFARRYTMVVNPCGWGLHVDVIWRTPEQIVAEFVAEGCTAVLQQTVELPPPQPFILRGVFTCVSVIKAALGLRNWRVVTPYGLFRFMLANGATVIFRRSDDDGHIQKSAGNGEADGAGSGDGGGSKPGGQGATDGGATPGG